MYILSSKTFRTFSSEVGRVSSAFLVMPLLALSIGCGQGEYDRRARLAQKSQMSAAKDSLNEVAIPITGTGYQIRLPGLFDGESESWNEYDDHFAKLPGFLFGYDRMFENSSGDILPAVVYIFAEEVAGNDSFSYSSDLLENIRKRFGRAADWEDVQFSGSENAPLAMKQSEILGGQPFDARRVGGFQRNRSGVARIYLYPTNSHFLVVIWRIPEEIEREKRFLQAAAAAMSSLTLANAS